MAGSGDVLLPDPLAYFLTWPTYGVWVARR
jgi:hypothetical protein